MINCEGYKAFRGTMRIDNRMGTQMIRADWLYKPEYNCWFGNGRSYPAFVCTVVDDETEER